MTTTRTRTRRAARFAAPLSIAMLGLVPLAAAPAHAAAPTTVVIATDGAVATHGERVNIRADVLDAGGAEVRQGKLKLQAKPVGGSWKTLRTVAADAAASGYWDFTNVKPSRNTDYRVKYAGAGSGYAKSTSARSRVTVKRKVTTKQVGGLTFRIRFSPDYAERKVAVTWRKKGTKKFKRIRTLTSNGKGWVRYTIPASKANGRFRLTSQADKKFASNYAQLTVS